MTKFQQIEFDPFAPDTIEEIFNAISLLEIWVAKAFVRKKAEPWNAKNDGGLAAKGRDLLLSGNERLVSSLEVLGEKMENSKRKVLILKTYQAYHAYRDMLHYYAVINLLKYLHSNPSVTFSEMKKNLKVKREKEWVNLGGQIIQRRDLDKLRSDIGSGKLRNWNEIHTRYNELWENYLTDKQKHAFATLCNLIGKDNITRSDWETALIKTEKIQQFICDQVYISRKKDYDNQFRLSTFRNADEMKAVLGTVDDNSFILQVKRETEELKALIIDIKRR